MFETSDKPRFRWGNYSMFIRYLVSFLLVLVIPLAAVTVYSFVDLNQRLEMQAYVSQQEELSRIGERLDAHFLDIQQSNQRLRGSTNLMRYKLKDLQAFGLPIINELRVNCGQNDLIGNIYMYSPDNPYVYSAYSSFTQKNFVAYITEGKDSVEEYAAFVRQMEGSPTPLYADKHFYLYFPFEQGGKDTVLIYELRLSNLQEQLEQELTAAGRYLAVYGEDDQLLAYTGDLRPEELDTVLSGGEGDSFLQRVPRGKSERNLAVIDSDYVGWHYVYLCKTSAVAEIVRQSNERLLLFLLVVLTAGSLLVFLFTYLSYRPIRELKTMAKEYAAAPPDSSGQNELELVRSILSSLHNSVEQLSGLESLSRRALKQYVVYCMALGLVRDYQTMRTSADQLGILEENQSYFAVLLCLSELLTLHGLDSHGHMEDYIEYIEAYPSGNLTICAVSGASFEQLILLVSASGEDSRPFFPFLQELCQSFMERFGVRAILSVGLAYPELGCVSISYMQALTAYEYRTISDGNCVIIFDPDAAGIGADVRNQNLLGYLQKAMDSANAKDVETTLSYAAQMADTEEMTIHNARFFCYGILKVVSASLYSYKYDYFSKFAEKYDLSMAMNIETIVDFKRFVLNLSEDTCRNIIEYEALCQERNGEEGVKKASLGELAGFIEENLSDFRLSAAFLAEQFGYSVSYFSKLFKETYGGTIYEYINERRMQRAKNLLVTTGATLESIVAEIGYLDTSSFIRKFKKQVGVTPGDYRKLHAAESTPLAVIK